MVALKDLRGVHLLSGCLREGRGSLADLTTHGCELLVLLWAEWHCNLQVPLGELIVSNGWPLY